MVYQWEGRKKLRLENYDYSQEWYYFVTMCTRGRLHHFWEIKNDVIVLNKYGKIAQTCWQEIIEHYDNVRLDEYVIMPNHIHGIIIVGNEYFRSNNEDVDKRSNISNIIKWFKIWVTKEIRKTYNDYEFVWQKSFYDVIIQNDEQLWKSREYIFLNPEKWENDVNNM